jgi:hypothetical protein
MYIGFYVKYALFLSDFNETWIFLTDFQWIWGHTKIFRTDAVKSINLTTKRVWKLPTSTQLRATWHTDSLDMVILSSTGALRYHNCCIDGGTSPECFGYTLVLKYPVSLKLVQWDSNRSMPTEMQKPTLALRNFVDAPKNRQCRKIVSLISFDNAPQQLHVPLRQTPCIPPHIDSVRHTQFHYTTIRSPPPNPTSPLNSHA